LKVHRYFFNRGSKSRNKVAVGEPAAGSFSDDQKQNKTQTRLRPNHNGGGCSTKPKTQNPNRRSKRETANPVYAFEHGSHNVSRWMTWLPISLKNAAKCDKWYQLQNLSITESLNANGARKKMLAFNSEHAMISVSNKNQKFKKQILCLVRN
jgi:hypothetical protein